MAENSKGAGAHQPLTQTTIADHRVLHVCLVCGAEPMVPNRRQRRAAGRFGASVDLMIVHKPWCRGTAGMSPSVVSR